MSRNPIFRATAKLYIALDHDEKEEVGLYYEFKSIVRSAIGGPGPFYDGAHATWYSKNIIFNNFSQSFSRRTDDGKKLWTCMSAAAVSTCITDLRTPLAKPNSMIAFLLGGIAGLHELGHCVVSVASSYCSFTF